jgi:hypothetical protein
MKWGLKHLPTTIAQYVDHVFSREGMNTMVVNYDILNGCQDLIAGAECRTIDHGRIMVWVEWTTNNAERFLEQRRDQESATRFYLQNLDLPGAKDHITSLFDACFPTGVWKTTIRDVQTQGAIGGSPFMVTRDMIDNLEGLLLSCTMVVAKAELGSYRVGPR